MARTALAPWCAPLPPYRSAVVSSCVVSVLCLDSAPLIRSLIADKFMQSFGKVLHEPQQAAILSRVKEVFQMVHAVYAAHQSA